MQYTTVYHVLKEKICKRTKYIHLAMTTRDCLALVLVINASSICIKTSLSRHRKGPHPQTRPSCFCVWPLYVFVQVFQLQPTWFSCTKLLPLLLGSQISIHLAWRLSSTQARERILPGCCRPSLPHCGSVWSSASDVGSVPPSQLHTSCHCFSTLLLLFLLPLIPPGHFSGSVPTLGCQDLTSCPPL